MADFCNACLRELFGDLNGVRTDLSGMSTEADTAARLYPVVLCEGCGPIQVDHLGEPVNGRHVPALETWVRAGVGPGPAA